jgi:class 3 adenylate cyclase
MSYARQVGLSSSEERLEKLIEERLKPNANKEMIDARIWNLFGETWAIMFTDLSGFSRGVAEFGIVHFLQVIYESQRILVPCIDENDGILLKTEGDSFMVIFRSPIKALECALEMNRHLQTYNTTRPEAEQILLCAGIGFGRVLRIGDQDVFGPEVNAAAKLGEDTARSWEILVTDNVRQAVDGTSYKFEPITKVPPGARAAFKLLYDL